MDDATRLLLDGRAGDRVALAAWVRTTQAEVWRLVAHLVDPDAADDLTQEVYLRAFRAMERFRGDASARTWLLAIARHTAVDEVRRRQRRRRFLAAAVAPDPVFLGSRIEVDDLLDRLSPDRREAFVLTQVLGLRYHEAAEVVGCPLGTIRSRVARAKEDLASAMGDEGTAAR